GGVGEAWAGGAERCAGPEPARYKGRAGALAGVTRQRREGIVSHWLALAVGCLALVASACIGGAGAPPTPTVQPPTVVSIPTVRLPALDTPGPQASPSALPSVVHTGAPGESLAQNPLRYYRDARRWQKIYDANRAAIPDPNALAVGTRLTIPPP